MGKMKAKGVSDEDLELFKEELVDNDLDLEYIKEDTMNKDESELYEFCNDNLEGKESVFNILVDAINEEPEPKTEFDFKDYIGPQSPYVPEPDEKEEKKDTMPYF